MIVIGLMSGTSADGIDAAVVQISGAPPTLKWKLVKHVHMNYAPELQSEILACCSPKTGTVDRICALNFAIGETFANAAIQSAQAAGLAMNQIELIGSHGQTIWHIPEGSTLQVGEPAVIAERTGVTTVSNLRTRDMAAGGQGAPLVPYLDVLVLTHPTQVRAAQNIGGIGNVTFLPPASATNATAFAFDTGPGNMLIDDATRRATNGTQTYDRDGILGARGKIDAILLAELMTHSFLKMKPPKTTGREVYGAHFGGEAWARAKARNVRDEDIVTTMTAFTAESIMQAYRDFLPQMPDEIVVSGGGALNPTLMHMMRERLAPARIITSDEAGLPSEAKEAIAFAIMAYEAIHHRPGNLPAATGAKRAVILGNITPGNQDAVSSMQSAISSESASLTEANNPATANIDALSTLEMLKQMNDEDARIAPAIAIELPYIAQAVDEITERLRQGGRLIYVGAGTSGRLGILDASEMPPTFSTHPEMVIGIIAGGDTAIRRAVEGAEDDVEQGKRDVMQLNISSQDCLAGLSASGRTPYVIGAMQQARERGALVISIVCNRPCAMEEVADIAIAPLVGPEVISGSTRMKAGTAEKLVLNMLSTGAMIRLGKTFGNLMVDLQATNSKLRDRARRIVEHACGIESTLAAKLLVQCNGEVKTAIVCQLASVSPNDARRRLAKSNGVVRKALEEK